MNIAAAKGSEPAVSVRGISVRSPQAPDLGSSLAQIVTSFGGLFAVCTAMYLLFDRSFWLALALAPLAAGFVIRIFIIQHDCGHVAFFRSRRANDILGMACSLFTLAPYASWRRHHAGHHGIWNNLDRRDSGVDIYSTCLTVNEYRALGYWRRLGYRLIRHPLVANVVLPPLVFLVLYRLPFDAPEEWRRERRAVYGTDLALIAVIGGLGLLVGFGSVVAVQLPVMVIAAIVGVWLFSVQHRFENTVWLRGAAWQFEAAALQGSSYLRLPRILQWFTGNIGFHHVHHLNPRIPNYRLQACHEASPGLWAAPTLTLGNALMQWRYVLWDEDLGRMVRFPAMSWRSAASTVTRQGHTVLD